MSCRNDGIGRRELLGVGVAAATAASVGPLLAACTRAPVRATGTPSAGALGRFGVDERSLCETFAAALSRGGEYADLFFQHRVADLLSLEDGRVHRANTWVERGVGVRVLKGDQTSYAYTEELTLDALQRAGKTAAAVADGPARLNVQPFRVEGSLPRRYRARVCWVDVSPQQKLPILSGLNARAFQRDTRIKRVSVSLGNEAAEVLVADSDGRLVEDTQPMTHVVVSCVAEQGGRREQGSWSRAGRAGFEFYTPELLAEMVDEAVRRTIGTSSTWTATTARSWR